MAQEGQEEIINNATIRFVGLARSGNHALINWTIRQIEGSYCFLNCTEPKYNPFYTSRPLREGGDTFQTNIPSFDFSEEQKGKFSRKDYLLYSHEDCFLGTLNSKEYRSNHEKWMGASESYKDVLVLRDPFNLFASRIKAGLIRGHYTHHGARPISSLTLRRIYKQHAREFLGKKNVLKNKVPVNFNRWATDEAYREYLAQELEIPFTDHGIKEVPGVAGGSSFDGVDLSGNAHKMNLNDRWRKYAEEDYFWEFFDSEIVELTEEIFGKIPPVTHFYSLFR